MSFDWFNLGNVASSVGDVADDFFAPAVSASDFASSWSPTALRASDIWSGTDFTPFSLPSLDFINQWSPTDLRSSDIFSGTDFTPFIDAATTFPLDAQDFLSPSTFDAASSASDYLSNWGLPDSMYSGSSDWAKGSDIMNQINPDVQAYLGQPGFGDLVSPVSSAIEGGAGYFLPYDPATYYGLTNPNLSEQARADLYKGISFASESGVTEFAKRLAAATGDTINMQTPDGGVVTARPDGKGGATATKKSAEQAKQETKGTQEKPKTTTGGTPAGGGSGLGALAALGLGAGMINLLSGSQSSGAGAKPPIRTVRDIAAPEPYSVAPRVVPYGEAANVNVPALARSLGAPMKVGGLASAVLPYALATGGRADYSHGAPVVGEGNGQDDKIPALLSDGEYVIDADTVAALGDGSNKAGAQILDKFREQIRSHKRSAPAHSIPPKAKSPLAYLKEAK